MKENISNERAIENLMVSYAYANDDADIKQLGQLFKDATFKLDAVTAIGSDEIEAIAITMIEVMPNGRSSTTHELTNIIIAIDVKAGTATGNAYWTLYKTIPGTPRMAVLSGRYHDAFILKDGQWYFKERNATILWKLTTS